MKIPKEAQELFNKANEHIDNKEFEKALGCLNKASEIEPNYAEAMSKLGYIHYKLNYKEMTKEEVFNLSKKALDLNPKSPIVLRYMGITYYNKKEYDKAMDCLKKAIELDANYANAWNNMGIAYNEKKEYDKAIECFEHAIDLDPNFIKAWGNLIAAYNKKGEMGKVINCIKQVKRLDQSLLSGNLQLKKLMEYSEKDFKKFENYIENMELVYQNFRKIQSEVRSAGDKFPNSKNHQILSKFDLSNMSDIIEDLKKNEFKNYAELINELKEIGAINLIPYPITHNIKKLILKIAIKYDRLHIAEIAEKCGEPEDCIIVVTQDMIKEKQIYAEYFKSTKSIVFDKQTNIDEIDSLMEQYKKWEKESIEKKY